MSATPYTDKNNNVIRLGDSVSYQTGSGKYIGKVIKIPGGYGWRHAAIDFHLSDMHKDRLVIAAREKTDV